MTLYIAERRRIRDGDRERLAERIQRRRLNRFWRRPNTVCGWNDLPLLRGVAPIGTARPVPSYATRHLQRLCGIPTHRARLLAELAGFAMEDET